MCAGRIRADRWGFSHLRGRAIGSLLAPVQPYAASLVAFADSGTGARARIRSRLAHMAGRAPGYGPLCNQSLGSLKTTTGQTLDQAKVISARERPRTPLGRFRRL
jgi:hypothetical protein